VIIALDTCRPLGDIRLDALEEEEGQEENSEKEV